MLRILLSASFATVMALAPALAADDHDHDDDHHVSEAHGVRVIHAWTRATNGPDALVFMEIENGADAPVTLTGGATESAASVDLVGFVLKAGEPAYEILPAVPIQPGHELELAPNGLALRLNGIAGRLEKGGLLEVVVRLDVGGIEVDVEVEDSDATRHSHAGHNH